MKEKFHLTDNVAILNFDLALPDTKSGLLKSEEFKAFALRYMDYLKNQYYNDIIVIYAIIP